MVDRRELFVVQLLSRVLLFATPWIVAGQASLPTNPDSVLKSRDITLLTKVHIVKAMVFQVVMYSC